MNESNKKKSKQYHIADIYKDYYYDNFNKKIKNNQLFYFINTYKVSN